MKRLSFTGYSGGALWFDGRATSNRFVVFRLQSPGGGMLVYAMGGFINNDPCGNGTWILGVRPLGHHVSCPPWPVSITMDGMGLSTTLMVDVPDDVSVELVARKAKQNSRCALACNGCGRSGPMANSQREAKDIVLALGWVDASDGPASGNYCPLCVGGDGRANFAIRPNG